MGDHIKREPKPNSFKIIENDSNNFLNVVCIGVIWISSTFNYYLISRNLEVQKIDLFYSTIISASADIVGFLIGYYFYSAMGIKNSLFRGFIMAVFGATFMLTF